MAIRILVTGGTFDKEYNERTGELFFKDTHLGEMLRLGRSQIEVTIRKVMMIDSVQKNRERGEFEESRSTRRRQDPFDG